MYICSMISVIEVYNTVRDLCNKDQKGFVTPSVFNTFAEIAQQNVFSEMFRELSGAKQLRARNLDASGKDSVYRGVKDDISRFITEVELNSELAGTNYVDANVFKRPTDLFKIASIHTPTDFTTLELVYDSDKMPLILSSNDNTSLNGILGFIPDADLSASIKKSAKVYCFPFIFHIVSLN